MKNGKFIKIKLIWRSVCGVPPKDGVSHTISSNGQDHTNHLRVHYQIFHFPPSPSNTHLCHRRTTTMSVLELPLRRHWDLTSPNCHVSIGLVLSTAKWSLHHSMPSMVVIFTATATLSATPLVSPTRDLSYHWEHSQIDAWVWLQQKKDEEEKEHLCCCCCWWW